MPTSLQLHGIITALVTPFSPNGEVLDDSVRELVRFQLRSGVHGLFPCGTTGMGPAMSVAQRRKVAEIVVDEVAGRVPVIIQVGAADPQASLDLAVHAGKIGATAIASLTPLYYQPGEDAVIESYRHLSEATSLPLLIYNIPRHTGNNVDVDLLMKLIQIPRIVGIKDSSRDFSQLLDYLLAAPSEFNVISGTDSFLFSALCAGANAGVSATANVFPELFVEIYAAYRAGNFGRGKDLQLKVHGLRAALSKPPLSPILEALKFRGLKSGNVKPPLRSMNSNEIDELRAYLSKRIPELVAA